MLWSELSPQSNGAPMIPAPASLVIELDASNMGWGATDGHSQPARLWSVEEAAHHINFLELLAVFLALKTFAKEHIQCSILCKSYYISAMTYLNQKGGMHSSLLCSLALEIWDWCLARGITLTAEHLLGWDNQTADRESRTCRGRSDRKLNPLVFQRIQRQMGPLEVDLFTSWLTALLPRFYSWRLDPEAEAIDAFTQNWGLNRSYANPPRCFINRYLNQVKQQQARIVLLTRSSTVDCMAHLWRSFSSQGLSTNVSELLLCSWISKTHQSYNSLCSRWMDWCQPRNRNPFEGPVSDVGNFDSW